MKNFQMDGLRYIEIPSKPQEKDPCHHHSWEFVHIYRYGQQYLTYLLPTLKFFVQTFVLENVWLKNTLPTYSLLKS